jgi:riboflavin synthase
MFTGIVQEIGTVRHLETTRSGMRVEIAGPRATERLAIDDSVSVAGVCLTVVGRDDRGFTSDIVPETLERTTLGRLSRGSHVNLETSATPNSALGGHFVQGHVDATTKLLDRDPAGDGARLRFALPKPLARYIVQKGFITLDGVSLTIARLGRTFFEIALIPHTAERTTLGALRPSEAVNVEVDVLAKYVERLTRRSCT